jgi:four helix bundle protein
MSETVKYYRELKVWQKAMDLTVSVYRLTAQFPSNEKFGLVSQMTRAAVSISSNIAEGSARSTKEFLRFISISQGSLAELETQLILSHRLEFAEKSPTETLLSECDEIGKMLRGLEKRLEEKMAKGEVLETPGTVVPFEPLATSH